MAFAHLRGRVFSVIGHTLRMKPACSCAGFSFRVISVFALLPFLISISNMRPFFDLNRHQTSIYPGFSARCKNSYSVVQCLFQPGTYIPPEQKCFCLLCNHSATDTTLRLVSSCVFRCSLPLAFGIAKKAKYPSIFATGPLFRVAVTVIVSTEHSPAGTSTLTPQSALREKGRCGDQMGNQKTN